MTSKKYAESLGEVWPLEYHQDAPLEALAYDAYGNEEFVGEIVYSAQCELKRRGYISQHELYKFSTWGN
jgi:hypothetical protein